MERFVREASGTELKFGYESTDSIRVSLPERAEIDEQAHSVIVEM